MRLPARMLAVLLLAALSGCSSENGDAVVVRGAVTYGGAPVAGGLINFYPDTGKPRGGPLDADGTYEFELPPGEYRVAIRETTIVPPGWKEGDPPPEKTLGVPEKYAQPGASGLTLSVPEGSDTIEKNFALE